MHLELSLSADTRAKYICPAISRNSWTSNTGLIEGFDLHISGGIKAGVLRSHTLTDI